MAATVVQSATNPGSNPVQYHRLVILEKLIPNDVFKTSFQKENSFQRHAVE